MTPGNENETVRTPPTTLPTTTTYVKSEYDESEFIRDDDDEDDDIEGYLDDETVKLLSQGKSTFIRV